MRLSPHQNTQVTDLGVAHKIDGVVIDLTDTAMQRETRRKIEQKYHDTRTVEHAKLLIRAGAAPVDILTYVHGRVTEDLSRR